MSPLRILIVEDEAVIAAHISSMLLEIGYEVLGIEGKYSRAVKFLEANKPDLVLLDIILGGSKDGVDLAIHMKELYPELPFIFLTSHGDPKTVDRAKRVRPNGYLTKPFKKEGLYASIEVAMETMGAFRTESTQEQSLETKSISLKAESVFIKQGHLYIKLQFGDILYMHAEGNYVDIIAEGQKYTVRSSLRDLLARLPEDRFFRIHKSYAVALNKVEKITSSDVIVKGQKLPSSKEHRDQLLSKLSIL